MGNKVTVLGLGNILLGDEGIGVRVVETLLNDYEPCDEVEIVDGGTSGIDLLPYLQKDHCLIIVDACRTGKGPGSILRLENRDVPAFLSAKLSPHQIGLPDLLATAELLDQTPRKLVLLGIEPKSMETGIELSAEIKGRIGTLLEMISEELSAEGVKLTKRAH